jgi:hypothetical protein
MRKVSLVPQPEQAETHTTTSKKNNNNRHNRCTTTKAKSSVCLFMLAWYTYKKARPKPTRKDRSLGLR